MKLTIITINLNNSSGLKKTMESVFSQTSKEFEYIVIDGFSTDDSVDVIQNFDSSLVQQFSWVSEKDNGIYHAMNKGIRMAKGEYCQFLNSGDTLVASEVTEKMLKEIPECEILYGNMLKLFPDGSVFYNKKIPNISLLTFYIGTLNHSPAYIKRSLFDKYGMYDETLKIVSDWKFYLITIGLNNVKVEYKDVDVAYFDMNGISNTNLVLSKQERRKVLQDLLPVSILSDYDNYWFDIEQMKRIKRYSAIKWIFWFVERILFKIEKKKMKRKKEHLFL